MLDLNTLRRIQALGPNYMADPGQLDTPGDLTGNPLGGLAPDTNQQNPLAALMQQARQQPPVGQVGLSTVPPQLPVPPASQGMYDNSPITGLMPSPQTSASIPQARVPDTAAAAGGMAPNSGSSNISMQMPQKPFPYQYGGAGDTSSSVTGGTGMPNVDTNKLSGLMPDQTTAGFEQLMAPGSTPVYDKYTQMLMQGPPNEANYPHSKIRNVMAALAGLGGNPQVTDYVQNLPYEKAKADYESRLKDLQTGTTEEEKMVSNKRGILTAQAMDQIRSQQQGLNTQKQQFAVDKLQQEMQLKTQQFEATQQRLYQQLAQSEGNFQAQLKLREMIADNEKSYRDSYMKWHDSMMAASEARNREIARMDDARIAEMQARAKHWSDEVELRRAEEDLKSKGKTTEKLFSPDGSLVGIRVWDKSQGSKPYIVRPGGVTEGNSGGPGDPGGVSANLPQSNGPSDSAGIRSFDPRERSAP